MTPTTIARILGPYGLHLFGAVALLLFLIFLWAFNFTAFFGAQRPSTPPSATRSSEIRDVEVVRALVTARIYLARDLTDQLTI